MTFKAFYFNGKTPEKFEGLLSLHRSGFDFKSDKISFSKKYEGFVFKKDYDYVWFENEETGERISSPIENEEKIKRLIPKDNQDSIIQFKKAINPSLYFLFFIGTLLGIYTVSVKHNLLGVTDLLFSQAEKSLRVCKPNLEFSTKAKTAVLVTAKNPKKIKVYISKLPFKNAFAFPGNKIIFTQEALKNFENEKEFLAVLAHEISHIELGHTDSAANVSQILFSAFGGSIKYAGAFVFNAYSRKRERAADFNAMNILEDNNLPTDGLYTFIKKLRLFKSNTKYVEYFSSHPLESRLEYLKKETSEKPDRSIFSKEDFELIKSGNCKD